MNKQDANPVNSSPAHVSKSPVPQASDAADEESSEEESEDDGRGVSVTPPREKEPRPDSDGDYQAENPASTSESEEQEEEEQEAEHEDSSPDQSDEEEEDLETKYHYDFSHALRTKNGQMEFLGRGQIKKLPKSDPAKSKKKVASPSSGAYIKLRSTCPYFDDDNEYIEPDCSDPRFHNADQKGIYHEICKAIDWDALSDSRLQALPSLIRAAGLEYLCNVQQAYDPKVLK